jgi:hypothetical protein
MERLEFDLLIYRRFFAIELAISNFAKGDNSHPQDTSKVCHVTERHMTFKLLSLILSALDLCSKSSKRKEGVYEY